MENFSFEARTFISAGGFWCPSTEILPRPLFSFNSVPCLRYLSVGFFRGFRPRHRCCQLIRDKLSLFFFSFSNITAFVLYILEFRDVHCRYDIRTFPERQSLWPSKFSGHRSRSGFSHLHNSFRLLNYKEKNTSELKSLLHCSTAVLVLYNKYYKDAQMWIVHDVTNFIRMYFYTVFIKFI